MITITIQLDSTVEQQLREKARRRGQTLEAYLQKLAEENARAANGSLTPSASNLSEAEAIDQWIQAWRAWAANHPSLPIVADDSRESIYEGRGE